MKKSTKILIGLTLSFSLVLALNTYNSRDKSSKTPVGTDIKSPNTEVGKTNESSTNKNPQDAPLVNKDNESSKVIYSNEAKYLPITEDMKMKQYMPPSEVFPQSNITYTVENITDKDFLNKYEKLLSDDGWKTVIDKKPESIMVEKGEHQAAIILQQVDKNLSILIMTQ
jgi:hypothetical protein